MSPFRSLPLTLLSALTIGSALTGCAPEGDFVDCENGQCEKTFADLYGWTLRVEAKDDPTTLPSLPENGSLTLAVQTTVAKDTDELILDMNSTSYRVDVDDGKANQVAIKTGADYSEFAMIILVGSDAEGWSAFHPQKDMLLPAYGDTLQAKFAVNSFFGDEWESFFFSNFTLTPTANGAKITGKMRAMRDYVLGGAGENYSVDEEISGKQIRVIPIPIWNHGFWDARTYSTELYFSQEAID